MIIGLTGGSGVGKSCASEVFEAEGFLIIDFDKISRDVTSAGSECLAELTQFFGDRILNADQSLNRRLLGEIVFSDKEKLSALNRITHKHILKKSDEITNANKDKNIIFDAPLLFEAGLEKKCDYVVSVLADIQNRIERICSRDSISEDIARNRIRSQHDDDYYINKSDFCVYNNSNIENLEIQIKNIIRSIFDESGSN